MKKTPNTYMIESLLRLMNIYGVRASQTWRTPDERKAYHAANNLLNKAMYSSFDAAAELERIYERELEHLYKE